MADIDIVPKHRSYTWLWILLAIIIIAAIWFALSSGSHTTTNPVGVLLKTYAIAV